MAKRQTANVTMLLRSDTRKAKNLCLASMRFLKFQAPTNTAHAVTVRLGGGDERKEEPSTPAPQKFNIRQTSTCCGEDKVLVPGIS